MIKDVPVLRGNNFNYYTRKADVYDLIDSNKVCPKCKKWHSAYSFVYFENFKTDLYTIGEVCYNCMDAHSKFLSSRSNIRLASKIRRETGIDDIPGHILEEAIEAQRLLEIITHINNSHFKRRIKNATSQCKVVISSLVSANG